MNELIKRDGCWWVDYLGNYWNMEKYTKKRVGEICEFMISVKMNQINQEASTDNSSMSLKVVYKEED